MTFKYSPHDMPDIILLVGTDASGKDHVANVLESLLIEEGGQVEKRKRFLSGAATQEISSTNKGFLDKLQEGLFLAFYPLLGNLVPLLFCIITRADLNAFSAPNKKLIVVGHNGLRAMAFAWARALEKQGQLHFPETVRKTFAQVQGRTGLSVIVLDVDPEVRQKRIKARANKGETDLFDRYMLANAERSERIEASLVKGAQELLGAKLMINNDMSDAKIKETLRGLLRPCARPASKTNGLGMT